MAEVVSIQREPSSELVDTLESMLEMAKTGELRAIAYATLSPGSIVGTGWTFDEDVNVHIMMSGITLLQYRFAQGICESDEPE